MRPVLRNPLIGFLLGLCIGLAACIEPVRLLRETAADARQIVSDLRSMFLGNR